MKQNKQTKCWQRCLATMTLMHYWQVGKLIKSRGKTVGQHPLKVSLCLLCSTTISILVYIRHTCIHMLTKRQTQKCSQQVSSGNISFHPCPPSVLDFLLCKIKMSLLFKSLLLKMLDHHQQQKQCLTAYQKCRLSGHGSDTLP